MYRRFLNNSDYLSIITPEALTQMTRGNSERFIQAEESAEMSILSVAIQQKQPQAMLRLKVF